MSEKIETPDRPRRGTSARVGFLLIGVAVVAVGYVLIKELTPSSIIDRESELRRFAVEYPWWTMVAGFLIYVLVTGLSIPGATLTTLILAWSLGFWRALPVVSFGSAAGATVAFLISRYFFQTWVRDRFLSTNSHILKRFENDGPYYLFTLRLTPVIPFFLINLLMGLSNIRTATFWWVSQVGMLPATIIYVYTGSTLPSLTAISQDGIRSILDWKIILALCLLGLLPITTKKFMEKFGRSQH